MPAAAGKRTLSGTNAVADGGFESDSYTYWQQCGDGASASIQKSVVHTGSWAAKMGGTTTEPDGDAGVCQSVTVPTSGVLTFWVDESTNETSSKYAYQEADLLDDEGDVLLNLYTDDGNSGGWVQRTYTLTAYAGQTVYLYFGTHGDGASGYHIVQYVDDVSLTSGSASPTPTPTPTPKPTATPSSTPSPHPTATPLPTSSPGSPLSLVTQASFVTTVQSGHNVKLSTYVLPAGTLLNALVAAAKAGGSVTVDMPDDAFTKTDGVYTTNASAATQLQAAGATVLWDAGTQSPNPEPLHAKLSIVDGVGYLDGRNWDSDDVIMRDTNANDLAVMTSALALTPIDGTQLDTIKQDALAMETSFITSHTSGTIYYMTESFGAGNVANALLAAAQAGRTVHVIVLASDVSATSKTTLTALKNAGADVELNPGTGSEKMTIVGTQAWFGSSNSTAGNPYQIDWGIDLTASASIVSALQSLYTSTLAGCTAYTS